MRIPISLVSELDTTETHRVEPDPLSLGSAKWKAEEIARLLTNPTGARADPFQAETLT